MRGVIVHRDGDNAAATGINVKLDLRRAVDAVVPSPFAASWFEGVLRETIARFGFDLPVEQSLLLAEPFY